MLYFLAGYIPVARTLLWAPFGVKLVSILYALVNFTGIAGCAIAAFYRYYMGIIITSVALFLSVPVLIFRNIGFMSPFIYNWRIWFSYTLPSSDTPLFIMGLSIIPLVLLVLLLSLCVYGNRGQAESNPRMS